MDALNIPFDTIRITAISGGYEITFIHKAKEMVTQTKYSTLVKGDSLWINNLTGDISVTVSGV